MADQPASSATLAAPARGRFAFTTEQLSSLHAPKNLHAFHEFGGLAGLEAGLHTNRTAGLNADETTVGAPLQDELTPPEKAWEVEQGAISRDPFVDRKRVFLDNTLPTKKQPTFVKLLWATYNDPVLFLLTAAAMVSLALGLYQALATYHKPGQPAIEWVEGVAILVAVIIIVLVGSVNDWQKLRQFRRLEKKQLERDVRVIRSNVPILIPISEVLVGDVVHLEPGDIVPADGILINGYNVVCNESAATGESDQIHKQPGDEVFRTFAERGAAHDELNPDLDPFLLSGTKIIDGIGTFLVTTTGLNSTYGKVLSSLKEDQELTPLQERLAVLAKYFANTGAAWALLLFVILLLKFLAQLPQNTQSPADKGKTFIDIFIISLTVLVIAVPEGLPLAVMLSLAYATTRMLKDHNLVRRLQACETMGNATNICSDKTGTLTQNDMRVVAGIVGTDSQFRDKHAVSSSSSDASGSDASDSDASSLHVDMELPATEEFLNGLSGDVKTLLMESIALNTTAIDANDANFVGSDTESALLKFARDRLGMGAVRRVRSSKKVVQFIPFSSLRQCMATVIELPHKSGPRYRVFIKGASEVMLARCSKIIEDSSKGCAAIEMSTLQRQTLAKTIDTYASQALRTISLVYRDFSPTVPEDEATPEQTDFSLEDLLTDAVFLAVVGLRDPLRPGVSKAVEVCQDAGVTVRMVTGDNIRTAKAIGEQSGIVTGEDDLIVEGAEFRAWTDDELDKRLSHLKIIARCSPSDKARLVLRLKDKGEIVAVTGDGTNDVAALSAADISFAMGGLTGTDIAREASSIILMNDDFSCVVKALMWGRCVDDSVKKFLQFQITITFTSVLLTFISAIAHPHEQSVLTPVQLLWVNLFQDTMAALALATDKPQERVLRRKPERRDAPLVSIPMWKTILGQSIYQLAVTIVLYFAGEQIFQSNSDHEIQQVQALVFNTYVWMQIFNMYNTRQHDNTYNIFEGVLSNWLFISVVTIMIVVQILIIFFGGAAFSVVPLTGAQWGISLVAGFLSLPIGALIRWLPDGPFEEAKEYISKASHKLWEPLKFWKRRGSDSHSV